MHRGRGEDCDPGKHVLFIVREPSAMLSRTMGLFLVWFLEILDFDRARSASYQSEIGSSGR